MSRETANIRDQIGSDSDTFVLPIFQYNEKVVVEEQSIWVNEESIGTSFILGHSTNGILGAGGMGLGSHGVVTTNVSITNPNRTYNEHFRDEDFKSDSETNSAYWNTTNYRLAAGTTVPGSGTAGSTATSSPVAMEDGTVIRARVVATETVYGQDTITFYLRTSSGNAWEEFDNGTTKTFTTSGTALQFQIGYYGAGGTATYIEDLRIEYN